MSADQVAQAFASHFYTTLDSQGAMALVQGQLYRDNSMMTFEGEGMMGAQNILNKLTTLGKLQHEVKAVDTQPSVDQNNLVIFVTGHILLEGQTNPLQFSEFFQLVCYAPGQYYIHNQIFRLIYS